MARTAERNLSSEERCRKAFLKLYSLNEQDMEELGLNDPNWFGADLWLGWVSCWKYLEHRVTKEFIEK